MQKVVVGRGESDSGNIVIKSICSKVLRSNFASFLSNGESKTRMIQLIFESIVKHKAKILNLLKQLCQSYLEKMNARR